MGNRIVVILEGLMAVAIVLFISSLLITHIQISNSVETTEQFTDVVKYKGYITQKMYNDLLESYDTSIQVTFCHQKSDPLNSIDVLDMTFTSEVIDALNTKGIYKLNAGDSFYVTVRRMTPYYYDIIASALSFKQPTLKPIIAVRGGLVLNEQY